MLRLGLYVPKRLSLIAIHVLEHQHKLVLGVDDVVKRHDVLMLEFLHQGDLADRCGRCALFAV